MLKVMGLDWMVQDEEWKDAVWAADTPKTGEFWDRLYEAVQSKTLAEWNEVFENDHDVWAETMRRGSELLDHPQMQHLGAVVEIDDAERGLVRQPGPIVKMFETPAVLERGAPGARRRRRGAAGGTRGPHSAGRTLAGAGSARGEAALGDVTLLELGTFFAAPFGGTVLREMGARVIKVEPMEGEPMRDAAAVPRAGCGEVRAGKGVHLRGPFHRRGARRSCTRWPSKPTSCCSHSAPAWRSGRVSTPTRCGRSTRTSSTSTRPATGSTGRAVTDPPTPRPSAPAADSSCATSARAIEERPGLSLREIRADAMRLAGAGTTEYAQADGISALTAACAMTLGLLVRDRTAHPRRCSRRC